MAFHVLAKPTGAICNLDCTYCFFLSKESLYPGSPFRMADDLLEIYLRQMIESQAVPEVTIAWQGGEPTMMGLDFFRHAFDLVETLKPPGMQVEHTIQTNGTLLDEEWCDFFREHGVLVGLSMDGPAEMHDTFRVDKGGKPTHARVEAAARLMQERGVEFNILCTVHAANADRALELYRYFRDDLGARYLQFIPIVERATAETFEAAETGWGSHRASDRPLYLVEGALVTDRSVTAEQWGSFLIEIFDEWVATDVGTIYVQMFDAALASWLGMQPSMCIFAETCGNALALEHNGDLYSCDHFVEPALPARQHPRDAHAGPGRLPRPAEVRPGQARHLADLLRRVPGEVRVPRRVPAQSLHRDAGGGPGPELPLRRLQVVLRAHRRADEADGRPAA